MSGDTFVDDLLMPGRRLSGSGSGIRSAMAPAEHAGSQDMLARAAERVGTPASGRVAYIQADLSDLPFRPRLFPTVACHGLLHLFSELEPVLHALRAQVAPGGTLYATSLVAETPIGSRWLRVLHRAGESAPPRRIGELEGQVRAVLGESVRVEREGCMGFITATGG